MPAPSDAPGLGRALRARWPLVLVLVLLGVGAGSVFAATRPTTYSAENRLVVGGQDLAAQAVPGFAQASKELASNYARIVTTGPVVQALPPDVAARVVAVTASPVPDSNVIRIEAHANNPSAATTAAALGRRRLLRQVSKLVSSQTPEKTLAAYDDLSRRVVAARQVEQEAQTKVDALKAKLKSSTSKPKSLVDARKALTDATTARQALELRQSALSGLYQQQLSRGPAQNGLTGVGVTTLTGDDRVSRLEMFGLVGAVWGAFVAALLAWALERRRRRRAAVMQQAQAPVPDDRFVDVRRARRPGAYAVPDGADMVAGSALPFDTYRTTRFQADDDRADVWPLSR